MWFREVEKLLAANPVRRIAPPQGVRRAAVLVPLYVAHKELWVLLTRRADELPHHAGQYSFPGGVQEPADEDEVATALRETEEELGIPPHTVMVLGHLDDVLTVTGFVISPVVGALPFPHRLRIRPQEVAAVVPIPFSAVANPVLVEEQVFTWEGQTHRSPVLHYGSHRIWGATARILQDLVARLAQGR